MDEGSYEPDANLKKIRGLSEEALASAYKWGLLKTKKEAEEEAEREAEQSD